jgi:phosphatidylglycerophosphate synthase
MSKVEKHKRENDILLGFLERPALNWLAKNAPDWVTPDLLTYLGIFASVLTFVSYALTNLHPGFLWLASLGFILNWLGDSLDGTLARYRHIERPRFGFLIDHFVDAVSAILMFLGLGISPYVNFSAAALATIGYLVVSIMVYLITITTGVFRITSAKIGPTEIRLLAIILNTVIFFVGNPEFELPLYGAVSFYTLFALLLALAMMIYFVINTSIEAHRLALLDGKRLERKLEKRAQAQEEAKPRNKISTAASEG